MEFVDINQSSNAPLNLNSLPTDEWADTENVVEVPLQTINFEQTATPTETFDLNPTEESESDSDSYCVPNTPSTSNILCPDPNGYFKVDNLFGELKTAYDKKVARTNLGITSKDLISWGDILGNLVNQTDLVNFISEQNSIYKQEILKIVQDEIDELDAQSSITTIYYGPSMDSMQLSNSTTFKTGSYDGPIYIASPKYPASFTINGLTGGFDYVGTLDKNGVTFFEYKSTYSKLGATEITVTYG